MRSVTLIIAAREKAGMICKRVIHIIIVKIKYQDAVISCFFFISKLTECFFYETGLRKKRSYLLYPIHLVIGGRAWSSGDCRNRRKAENRLDKKRSYQRQITSI